MQRNVAAMIGHDLHDACPAAGRGRDDPWDLFFAETVYSVDTSNWRDDAAEPDE